MSFVITDRLDQVLTPPREIVVSAALLLQRLYDRKFTGPVTLHFKQGKLMLADVPVHLKIEEP